MSEENAVAEEVVVELNPLNDLFDDGEKGEEVPAPPVEPEPEEKGEEVQEPPSEPEEEVKPAEPVEEIGLKAALMAERQKRQEAEARLAEAAIKPDLKDFWDDPEGRLNQMAESLRAENQANFLNLSESQAKARHEDYDAKYQVFKDLVSQNPTIVQEMLRQPDPAEYVYQTAKNHEFILDVGKDPAAYRAKIEAEIKNKLESEFNKRVEEKVKKISGLPPSASSLSNKLPLSKPPSTDPLREIFSE